MLRCTVPYVSLAEPITQENPMPNDGYEIPNEMRDFAERSVEQARKAFDSFMTAAHKATSTFGSSTEVAQAGVKDLSRQAMTYAETNVTATFEFARQLLNAKDVGEVLQLQAEFARSQMEALGRQMQDMSQAVTQTASRTTAGGSPTDGSGGSPQG
jgi:phasin